MKDNLVWPNGLIVDEEANKVVWADARTEVWRLDVKTNYINFKLTLDFALVN